MQMLLELWKRVASHSEQNGMTAGSLAEAVAPCMAWEQPLQHSSAQACPVRPNLFRCHICPLLLDLTLPSLPNTFHALLLNKAANHTCTSMVPEALHSVMTMAAHALLQKMTCPKLAVPVDVSRLLNLLKILGLAPEDARWPAGCAVVIAAVQPDQQRLPAMRRHHRLWCSTVPAGASQASLALGSKECSAGTRAGNEALIGTVLSL